MFHPATKAAHCTGATVPNPRVSIPHIATGVPEHKIITALMEGLVAKDSKTLEPRPAVASSWDISEDGRLYTFYLRKDARWSNGDPHNAHDYVWSWWRALQPALGNLYAYMYFPIDNAREYYEGSITNFDQVGVKALDDHTLQVRLKNPTPTSCSCWITTACFRSIVLPLKSLVPGRARHTLDLRGQPGGQWCLSAVGVEDQPSGGG